VNLERLLPQGSNNIAEWGKPHAVLVTTRSWKGKDAQEEANSEPTMIVNRKPKDLLQKQQNFLLSDGQAKMRKGGERWVLCSLTKMTEGQKRGITIGPRWKIALLLQPLRGEAKARTWPLNFISKKKRGVGALNRPN